MFDGRSSYVIGPMDTIGDVDNAVIEAFRRRMQTEPLDRVDLANAAFA
jgi:hypothetical protein